MPEGHTIHRLARDLNRDLKGKCVSASSPQGRFHAGAKTIDSQQCRGFEAFGKHLVGHFGDVDVLHVHLGLIGKFRPTSGDPIGAVRLRLTGPDEERNWDLRGPMVCTVGPPDLAESVADSVGPDPLRRSGKSADFIDAMSRRRIAVGAALLDQKVVAGIGNVYRAELLFLAGISPTTPANQLSSDDVMQIWDLASAQLRQGVKLNRIVTVDPTEVGSTTVRAIPRGDRLYVYKREGDPCRRCATPIAMSEVGGRKLWHCPTCQ